MIRRAAHALQAARLHRQPWLLRGYRHLPHSALDATVAALMATRWPRPLLRALIDAWVARGGIDMAEVAPDDWQTLEAFFLRRLRPDARPIGDGIVCPADGFVVSVGAAVDGALTVKGQALPLDALLRRAAPTRTPLAAALARGRAIVVEQLVTSRDLEALQHAWHLTVFLTPDGYHHVHAPIDGELVAVSWLPGRTFPQNDDALAALGPVYSRNERALLRLRTAEGADVWLLMVAASLVGGIDLEGLPRSAWMRPTPTAVGRAVQRGDRLGCFRFGSTIVLLLPPPLAAQGTACALRSGDAVRVGQAIAPAPAAGVAPAAASRP